MINWELTAKNGIKSYSFPNAMLAVKKLGLSCRHDVFHDRKLVEGDLIEDAGPELSDALARAVRDQTVRTWGFDPGGNNIQEALERACESNRFDPAQDYLDGLQWDGLRRLDMWLTVYLGAQDTPLNRAFGRKTLLAAVRRVRQPGCKFDHMLILEGKQGAGKSSAIRILAGDDNFSDQRLDLHDGKAQQEATAGVWLYEISELEGLRKVDVETIKAFLSRTSDNVRPAYGRYRVDRPRRCIFIGTTNAGTHSGYLRDTSGNRRFWPIATGKIDLEALARDRDQIWAEAAAAEATGESLAIDACLYGEAARQQAARTVQDPWEDILAAVKGEVCEAWHGGRMVQLERAATHTLLTQYLHLQFNQMDDRTVKPAFPR